MLLLYILIKHFHADIQSKQFFCEYLNTASENYIYVPKNLIPSTSLLLEPMSFQAEYKRNFISL